MFNVLRNQRSVTLRPLAIGFGVLVLALVGTLVSAGNAVAYPFLPKTDFPTDTDPYSVAVGDFNGDGKADLATAQNGPSISVLLGTGTGSFGPHADFAPGGDHDFIAVGQFNSDQDAYLDLVLNSTGAVSILLGTGTGTFGPKTDLTIGSFNPSSVAVGQFNSDVDAYPDLAVASGVSISILLGTGTGSFGPKTDFATGGGSLSVAVGQFNSDVDAYPDLAVTTGANDVAILLGTGSGSFGPKTGFATGNYPDQVAIGQFNSGVDAYPDLATANVFNNTVSILLGTGTGTFGPKTDFATGANPLEVAVGEYSGDASPDLAVVNVNSNTVSVLLGTPLGTFGPKTDFPVGNCPTAVASADFNGDGRGDLVAANGCDASVSILLNDGCAFSPGLRDHRTDRNADGYSCADEVTAANCGVGSCSSIITLGTAETATCKDAGKNCGTIGPPANESVAARIAVPPATGYGCSVTLDIVPPLRTTNLARSDIDLDGSVSILDLSKAAGWFGNPVSTSFSDPRWEANLDDVGGITILDLAAIASNYGRSVANNCKVE